MSYAREPHDWYVEPPAAVEALLEAERFHGSAWDPACGQGTIPAAAHAWGLESFGSDLVQRPFGYPGGVDFLGDATLWPRAIASRLPVDNIICNPPFGLAIPFLERALQLARYKVALLLRLKFLESRRRLQVYRSTPIARVLVFADRISCPPGSRQAEMAAKGGTEAYAWFVWSHDHKGPASIDWLTARPAKPRELPVPPEATLPLELARERAP